MSIEKNNKALPEKWITCKLKDVGEIVAGGTPSTNEPSFWGDEVSWITPADLSGYKSMFIEKGRKSISKKGLQNSSAKLIPKGSVLFSSRAPIGYVVIASNELATNQGFKNIVPYSGIDSKYLYYYLMANKQLAEENASGTTFKEISATKFAELPLVLAPSNQQVRISDKLDELLSELEKGKEQLQTSLEQLKVYRQSILKHAFEGKLTKGKFNEGRLPNGWKWVKLGNIAAKITDGEHITPRRTSEGFLLLSARNVHNGYLHLNNVDYVPKDEFDRIRKRCNPEYQDILISCSGTIGRVSAVPANLHFVMVRSVALVKLDWDIYSSKFYEYLLRSPLLQRQIDKSKKATAQANLFLGPIKNLDVISCSIKDQLEVVSQIESRFSICEKLEDDINEALKQSEILMKSLLQKAFEGKLVEQDPTDEPASVLLERIQKEREEYLKAEKESRKKQNSPKLSKKKVKVG